MSATAGRAAGGFVGGIANNPGIVAIAGIAITVVSLLLIFRKDISTFFEGFGKIELPTIEFPDITFPEFPDITFPEFPDITFPEFPDFGSFFENFFNGGDGEPVPPPPGEQEVPGLGTVTTPEGCTIDENGIIRCPTPPTFDVCETNPELCETEIPGMDPGLLDEPTDAELFAQDFPGDEAIPPPPFEPPLELPEGFVGEGISFEGGTIFETPICNLSIGDIAERFGISASAAADMKFQACETSDFDFGTNTGSGFGPGDDPLTDPLVTGGATLESEEQRAACTSCELFGLNCPICRGEIGA